MDNIYQLYELLFLRMMKVRPSKPSSEDHYIRKEMMLRKWCLKEFNLVPTDLVVEFHLTAYQSRRVLRSFPAILQATVHLLPSLYYKILSLICCTR
jgi:hypothetical protein